MKRQESLTLVELLAVIATITLLMAILLPTLSRTRQQAQATICKSNLSQIGLAAYLYTDSWNYYLPRGTGSADKTWFELLLPYLSHKPTDNDYRNVRIYHCPAYPDKEQTVCFVNNTWEFNSPDDSTGHFKDEPIG